MQDWWPFILKPDGREELGELLAKHPSALARTQRLCTDLSVTKLVRIANAEHNYCGLGRDIGLDIDVASRADDAWRILELTTRTISMKDGTAWTRTISLLSSESSVDALEKLADLPINRIIVACERLIRGPYRSMTKSGGPTRW